MKPHPQQPAEPRPQKEVKVMHVSNMEITFDVIDTPEITRLPKKVRSRMEACHELLHDSPAQIVEELETLTRLHPEVLCMRNWLFCAYQYLGRDAEATQVCESLMREHPDYLFARISKVEQLIQAARIDEARDLLFRDGLSLPATYPDRRVFHISEVRSWFLVCGRLQIGMGDFGAAASCRDLLHELEPGSRAVAELDRLMTVCDTAFRQMVRNMKKGLEKDQARAATRAAKRWHKPGNPNQSELF